MILVVSVSCGRNRTGPGITESENEIETRTTKSEIAILNSYKQCHEVKDDFLNCLEEALKSFDDISVINERCAKEALQKHPSDTEAIKNYLSQCVADILAEQKKKRTEDPDGTKARKACATQAWKYVQENIQSETVKTELEQIITVTASGPTERVSGHCAGMRKDKDFFICSIRADIEIVCANIRLRHNHLF